MTVNWSGIWLPRNASACLPDWNPSTPICCGDIERPKMRYNVIDDVAYAESQRISITYGYLFDPRYQKASEMECQICAIAENPLIPMPVYLSVIAPLAGTESFWDDLTSGRLAPNLRLRDLDGETIAYAQLADRPEAIVDFVERIFRRPWTVVGRAGILLKTFRRLVRARSLNPIRWYFSASANLPLSHGFLWPLPNSQNG